MPKRIIQLFSKKDREQAPIFRKILKKFKMDITSLWLSKAFPGGSPLPIRAGIREGMGVNNLVFREFNKFEKK
jgi:hypothetical protein